MCKTVTSECYHFQMRNNIHGEMYFIFWHANNLLIESHIYPKYLDTLPLTILGLKFHFITSSLVKTPVWMLNSVNLDQTPYDSAVSDLNLHCLLRPICPNTWGRYGKYLLFNLYHSLGIFSRRQNDVIFLIFPRKQDLTFHANCLLRRQFAWNVKSCFLGKIRKIFQNVVCWKFYPEC